jgi:hypothetical protein
LIATTKTTTGLSVKYDLDNNEYQKGIKVQDKELESLNIKSDKFHGEWNYTFFSRTINISYLN